MEQNSESVTMGKLISEATYIREKHEIHIADDESDIVLDFYDGRNKIIHEVKKSDKMEETHMWQVKYYIYVLEKKGVLGVTGEIDYPKLRQKQKVELSEADKIKLEETRKDIENIISLKHLPGIINKPFCKKCSYYELCYV